MELDRLRVTICASSDTVDGDGDEKDVAGVICVFDREVDANEGTELDDGFDNDGNDGDGGGGGGVEDMLATSLH